MLQQLLQQEMGALRALALNDGRQRVHPLTGFLRVRVVGGGAEQVVGLC